MEKFNKETLVGAYLDVKEESGEEISDAQAKRDVDDFLTAIMNVMESAKDAVPDKKGVRARLQIVNFGGFELRQVPARKHKNPQNPTAEPIHKPAYNKVVLTLGKAFEEIIN